jgi:geranylgeranyl pyrophosphate synthase
MRKISFTGPRKLDSTVDTLQSIQLELDKVEQLMVSQAAEYHPDLKNAVTVILKSGGKRIRPRIILLIGNMLHADRELLIYLATSIEMLHTASLVHDDLIDGSLLRRGIPTLNSRWSPAATVLTGDFLFASASDMAAKTRSVEIMRLIARCLMTIVDGEIHQLFSNCCSLNIDDYYRRIFAKTASLFETSTHCAAILGTESPDQVEALRRFGYELGMAFQVTDDILDYTGDQTTVGKPIGGDLRQGLVTLPLIFYMDANPDDSSVKTLLAGNRIQEEEEIQRLVQSTAASDAIQRAHNVAVEFARKAEANLAGFRNCPEHDALLEITRFIIEREK